MDPNEKNQQRERYLRALKKHHRTRDERKHLEEEARKRKAGRADRKRGGQRSGHASDDEQDFEKIARGPRFRREAPLTHPALGPPGATTALEPERALPDDPRLERATVIAVHRDRVRVRNATGELDALPARGAGAPPRPAVGDVVRLRSDDGPVRVVAIEPRRSVLARRDPGDGRRERVLAANVDHAVIVASARRPDFKPGLVERVRLALGSGGVRPVVCVNKADLLESAAARAELEEQLSPWRAQGVPCLLASAETGAGMRELAALLSGSTCVFVGHSGVGKSSLLNALDPERARLTGRVRTADGKGRHTTTSSQMVELPGGTRVIDTPGVRLFGLWRVSRAEVDAAFPEVAEHAGACRFRDCRHDREPGCAVQAAIAAGGLSADRAALHARLREEAES